jgi:heme/copper-type cytochrome/quinol oxidase subunit 4
LPAQTGGGNVAASETHSVPGMKSNAGILIVLLCIVGIEVLITYQHLSTHMQILSLLILAFIEAGIAVMYFMHLKYERSNLLWSMIILIFVLIMMDHIWPDALRLEHLRVIHW